MEQRLDATYLRSGPFERATAIGIVALATGTGILLASWGISFLWRYTPPEIKVHIANPEVLAQQAGNPRKRSTASHLRRTAPATAIQSPRLGITVSRCR
jgi:hypothetical protein